MRKRNEERLCDVGVKGMVSIRESHTQKYATVFCFCFLVQARTKGKKRENLTNKKNKLETEGKETRL